MFHLIDNSVKTAGTLRAAIALVERASSVVVSLGALMDDTTADTKVSHAVRLPASAGHKR